MNVQEPPLSRCLRPDFTARILQQLSKGQSVNVFGAERPGLKKLVDDIRHCCPDGNTCVGLSMRSYAHSFRGFLTALCDALGVQETEKQDMRTTLLGFIDRHPGQIWLCLEDFDQLSERTVDAKSVDAQGYNIDFLNHLNSFRNIPRISLLFTSTYQLDTRELYIGGKRVRGSVLDIPEHLPLPALDFQEIENYLAGIVPARTAQALAAKPPFYTPLITEIAAHPAPSEFMHYIADKVPADPNTHLDDFLEKMRYWKQEYAAHHALSWDLRLNNIARDTSHWSRRAGRVVGVGKNLKSIHKKLLLTAGLLAPMLYFWWGKVLAFFHWLLSLTQ